MFEDLTEPAEAMGNMSDAAQAAADSKMYVKFYMRPMLDELATNGGLLAEDHPRLEELVEAGRKVKPSKTEEGHVVVSPAGRPIYRDTEFVIIMRRGDRDLIVDEPVTDAHRRRFRQRYVDWKAGNEEATTGTPLEQVPFVTAAQREEFAFFKVRTAEQLLDLDDTVVQKFMGIRQLQERVRRFLEAADGAAARQAHAQELALRDAKLSELEGRVAELMRQLDAATAPRPAKQGK
jgi:hypothetical protein